MADHRKTHLHRAVGRRAGAFLRFSVTFAAKDQADERRVLGEIRSRLEDVAFEF